MSEQLCHIHNRAHFRPAIATVCDYRGRVMHKCKEHLDIYLDNMDTLSAVWEPEWMIINGVGYGNVPIGEQ